MNIINVLPLGSAEGSRHEQWEGKEGNSFEDILLFSLLLNNVMDNVSDKPVLAAGQRAEELLAYKPVPGEENSSAEMILGQNAYIQILQDLFPAGKEANSGLNGGQNLNISQDQVSDPWQVVKTLLASEFPKSLPKGYSVLQSEPAVILGEEQVDSSLQSSSLFDGGARPLREKEAKFLKAELARILGEEEATVLRAELAKVSGQRQVSVIPKQNVVVNPDELTYQFKTENETQLDNKVRVDAAAVKALGLEGNPSPKAREFATLVSTELDDYIVQIGKQLQELSGKLELGSGSGEQSTKFPEQPLAQEEQRENQSEKQFSGKQSDWQIAQTGNRAYEMNISEAPLENRIQDSVETSKVWSQVLESLFKQKFNTEKEIKELTIQLQPEELGKVKVLLRLENGLVHLVLHASEQATSFILQSHLQDLKNGLVELGVNCGNFEMAQQDNGNRESEREFSRFGSNYSYQELEEENTPLFKAAAYYTGSGSGSRINVSA
ncbi:MAG TPA: flagellar hook-length control protein FliK [Peptococcaceae bacterium]|nr:flagellar hook-length control protein FliK [Peptococcaceae bacterium]